MNTEDYINQRLEKIQKTADEGYDVGKHLQNVRDYIKDNPDLLKRIGLGAGIGTTGGLLASGVSPMNTKKGLIYGALLGALSGGTIGHGAHAASDKEEPESKFPWGAAGLGAGATAGAGGLYGLGKLRGTKAALKTLS